MLLFLCGDFMPGRGIDQILPVPNDPDLYEGWIRDARDYVGLAERKEGPLPRRVPFGYIWGEALRILERFRPAARIVNLETAITSGGRPEPGKGIHYRMHPGNAPCLAAGGIDVAVLANNHVCDWGWVLRCNFRGGVRPDSGLSPFVDKFPVNRGAKL